MDETTTDDSPATEAALTCLRDLRRVLLRLHKVLLDDERIAYEQMYGRVTSGELLQLVINHEQFAWLHPVSELIVSIDEVCWTRMNPWRRVMWSSCSHKRVRYSSRRRRGVISGEGTMRLFNVLLMSCWRTGR